MVLAPLTTGPHTVRADRLAFATPVREAAGGHWITLGHHDDEEGGGVHVYIGGGSGPGSGTITKGPKGLLGHHIAALATHPSVRGVKHHPAGHEPPGAKEHPHYAESAPKPPVAPGEAGSVEATKRPGKPYARLHGADQGTRAEAIGKALGEAQGAAKGAKARTSGEADPAQMSLQEAHDKHRANLLKENPELQAHLDAGTSHAHAIERWLNNEARTRLSPQQKAQGGRVLQNAQSYPKPQVPQAGAAKAEDERRAAQEREETKAGARRMTERAVERGRRDREKHGIPEPTPHPLQVGAFKAPEAKVADTAVAHQRGTMAAQHDETHVGRVMQAHAGKDQAEQAKYRDFMQRVANGDSYQPTMPDGRPLTRASAAEALRRMRGEAPRQGAPEPPTHTEQAGKKGTFGERREATVKAMQDKESQRGTPYRVLGVSDDVTTCEICGKPDLKRTVALHNEVSGVVRAGSDCAAMLLRTSRASIEKAARQHGEKREAAIQKALESHPNQEIIKRFAGQIQHITAYHRGQKTRPSESDQSRMAFARQRIAELTAEARRDIEKQLPPDKPLPQQAVEQRVVHGRTVRTEKPTQPFAAPQTQTQTEKPPEERIADTAVAHQQAQAALAAHRAAHDRNPNPWAPHLSPPVGDAKDRELAEKATRAQLAHQAAQAQQQGAQQHQQQEGQRAHEKEMVRLKAETAQPKPAFSAPQPKAQEKPQTAGAPPAEHPAIAALRNASGFLQTKYLNEGIMRPAPESSAAIKRQMDPIFKAAEEAAPDHPIHRDPQLVKARADMNESAYKTTPEHKAEQRAAEQQRYAQEMESTPNAAHVDYMVKAAAGMRPDQRDSYLSSIAEHGAGRGITTTGPDERTISHASSAEAAHHIAKMQEAHHLQANRRAQQNHFGQGGTFTRTGQPRGGSPESRAAIRRTDEAWRAAGWQAELSRLHVEEHKRRGRPVRESASPAPRFSTPRPA